MQLYSQMTGIVEWAWFTVVQNASVLLTDLMNKPFELINILLQTAFLSLSILNILAFFMSVIGLYKVASFVFKNQYSMIISIIVCFCVHGWQWGIGRPLLVMNLMQICGAYMCLGASQGCYYVYRHFKASSGKNKKQSNKKVHELFQFVAILLIIVCIIYVLSFNSENNEEQIYKPSRKEATYKSGKYQYQYSLLNYSQLIIIQAILSVILIISAVIKQDSLLFGFIAILASWATLAIRFKTALLQLQNIKLQLLSIPFQAIILIAFSFEANARQADKTLKKNNSSVAKCRVMVNDSIYKATLFFVLFCMLKGMIVQTPMLLLLTSIYGVITNKFP